MNRPPRILLMLFALLLVGSGLGSALHVAVLHGSGGAALHDGSAADDRHAPRQACRHAHTQPCSSHSSAPVDDPVEEGAQSERDDHDPARRGHDHDCPTCDMLQGLAASPPPPSGVSVASEASSPAIPAVAEPAVASAAVRYDGARAPPARCA